MSDLRTAAQQALEALEYILPDTPDQRMKKDVAITALKAALAEPVQEPVAMDWLHKWANQDDGEPETQWHEGYEAARRVVQIHLTAPPQRKPLTEEEIVGLSDLRGGCYGTTDFARAIERAHGIV